MERSADAPTIVPGQDGKVRLSTLSRAYTALKKQYRDLQIRDNEKIDWINQAIADQMKRFGVQP